MDSTVPNFTSLAAWLFMVVDRYGSYGQLVMVVDRTDGLGSCSTVVTGDADWREMVAISIEVFMANFIEGKVFKYGVKIWIVIFPARRGATSARPCLDAKHHMSSQVRTETYQ